MNIELPNLFADIISALNFKLILVGINVPTKCGYGPAKTFCPAKMQFKFGKYQIYNEPFLGKIFWCLYEMKKKTKTLYFYDAFMDWL